MRRTKTMAKFGHHRNTKYTLLYHTLSHQPPPLPYRPILTLPYPSLPIPNLPSPNPNPTLPYSTTSTPLPQRYQYPTNFTPTLPTLLHYPTLLGYVRLGKDGVVLGKHRFSKDVPLRYHEISLQFIQLYVNCTCTCRSKSTSILMCV